MTLTVPARLRHAGFLVVAAALSGCAASTTNLVTGETQRTAYTWQQEVQIGRESDAQIVAQFGLYDDAGVSAYVDRISRDVLATSAYTDPNTPAEIRNTPFTFRVLDSPVPNAFALPGGYIYVTRGLMAYLENEAQLAVVLGHEIGHVLGRHASVQAARAQLGQLGLLGAAVLGGAVGGGRVAEGILNYGGTGTQLLFLRYGRDAEREADLAGVSYAGFAGYDGSEGARFFRSLRRLGEGSGGSVPSFLSTHPDPGEREQTIPQIAAQTQQGTNVNQAEYYRAISGMVLGEDPRQGYEEGGAFLHPELRFRLDIPTGWRTTNTPQAVQFAEPNGRAALQLRLSQQASAQAAAQAFGAQQGVQLTGTRAERIGGYSAVTSDGTATTQQGAQPFTVAFVEYDGRVYEMVGLYAPAAASTALPVLRQTVRSFARLTDARALARQPSRIETETLTQPRSIQQLLSGRTIPLGVTAEEIAIMNQVTLSESIPRGTRVKLPRP